MIKVKALFFSFLGFSSVANSEIGMKCFQSTGNVFEVQAPVNWRQYDTSEYL